MNKIKIFGLATCLIAAFAVHADMPKVPRGVRSVAFVDVKQVSKSDSLKRSWENYNQHSRNFDAMYASFKDAELRAFLEKAGLKDVETDWLLLAVGSHANIAEKNGLTRIPSFAVVASGTFDAKHFADTLAEDLNADIKNSVKSIGNGEYVVDLNVAFGQLDGLPAGVEPCFAALSDTEIAFASNRKMLASFRSVYADKLAGSAKFDDLLEKKPGRFFTCRVTQFDQLVKEVEKFIGRPLVLPVAFDSLEGAVKHGSVIDLQVTAENKGQLFEISFTCKNEADAEFLHDFVVGFRASCSAKDVPEEFKEAKDAFSAMKIQRDGKKLSVSFSIDFLELSLNGEKIDRAHKASSDDDDDVEL